MMTRRLPKVSAEKCTEIREAVPYQCREPWAARREVGLKGRRFGDCVTRAISNALELDYGDVRIALQDCQKSYGEARPEGKSWGSLGAHLSAKEKGDKVHQGLHKVVYAPLLESLGLVYESTPTHRTTVDEPCIPPTAILEMPRHLAAKVQGTIVDSWDSRFRRVEGFWYDPTIYSVDYENGSWQAL